MHGEPRYVWYGDDFTGASDTLATVAAAGLRACLFLAPPTTAQRALVGELDALGIAGTARALDPTRMRDELAPVAAYFATLQPDITHYKCCSTYDSSPTIGNLHIGLRALRQPAHTGPVVVLGGQPSLGRYCAFGNLFASAGQGGEVHRIDRHPTMSRHPVTPMHEADLRRHLAAQGLEPIGLVDGLQLDTHAHTGGDDTLDRLLAAQAAGGAQAVLLDTTRAEHLHTIGRALWRRAALQPLLALGASSVAQALIAAWPQAQPSTAASTATPPALDPVFVLAGSLSPVTAAQVAAAGEAYAPVTLDASALTTSDAALDAAVSSCAALLATGRSVLARTSSPGEVPPAADAVARASGRVLARVLASCPQVKRVGVAGGDTSSWALRELDPWGLQWLGTLSPGVALLRARADDPRIDGLELALKGGQMGPADFFGRLLRGMP